MLSAKNIALIRRIEPKIAKNNPILKSILDKTKNAITIDEEIKLKQKWVNTTDVNNSILSPHEIKYLQNKKVLNMCIEPNWLPYEKIENGK